MCVGPRQASANIYFYIMLFNCINEETYFVEFFSLKGQPHEMDQEKVFAGGLPCKYVELSKMQEKKTSYGVLCTDFKACLYLNISLFWLPLSFKSCLYLFISFYQRNVN